MRKLLVVLAVLLAVGLFAGHWSGVPGTGFNATLSGTVTIVVHQWLDATFTPETINITDYGTQTIIVGNLWLKSNAEVDVTIKKGSSDISGFILPSDPTKVYLGDRNNGKPDNGVGLTFRNVLANDQTYTLKVEDVVVEWNLAPDVYSIGYQIIITPTVKFN